MKKTLLIIGLALAGVVNHAAAQTVVNPSTQSESVSFTLDPATASGFMAYASISRAQITVQGTNTVIRGMATITVPTTVLLASIGSPNVPPAGYDATNFSGGNVVRGTNGFTGTANFTKPAQ